MIDRLSAFTQTGLNRPAAGRPGKSSSAGHSLRFTPLQTNNQNIHAILACSAADVSREHRELFGMRRLGEDRRGFFDHFKPASFIKGAVRVVMTQGSTIYSTYLSDQLREDMRRDELVNEGRMSRSEAEQQAEEWEKQEWPKRWETFPKKLFVAYAKYHAITVVMRIYEAIAAKMFDDVMVDKLTIDTYSSSLRREKAGQKVTSREMFAECWYSNLVCYLADYSVHQIIVTFSYFVYVREQRRKLKSKNEKETNEAANELHPGSLVLSFTKKSVALAFTRAVGLFFASVGGVIGNSFWPGWGTVIGINMGDGFAITLTDEIVTI